jgi:hypothetical protein
MNLFGSFQSNFRSTFHLENNAFQKEKHENNRAKNRCHQIEEAIGSLKRS